MAKSYEQMLCVFKEDGKDFRQKHIFVPLPPKLMRYHCTNMDCLNRVPLWFFFHGTAIAEFFPIFQLAQKLNISGFLDFGHRTYPSMSCQLGATMTGIVSGVELRSIFPNVVQRYQSLRLTYGDDPTPASPFKFTSLSKNRSRFPLRFNCFHFCYGCT